MGIEPDKLRGVYADLARIIGTERFLALCETFGGTNLYVPKIDRVLQKLRNEEIRHEFGGQNYKLLATFATDTHALVYHLTGQGRRLGRKARSAFGCADRGLNTILIPFCAMEEVLLLSEAGKIRLRLSFRELVLTLMRADNFELGTNNAELLLEAAALRGIKDPYDRMIVAEARSHGVALITGDEEIQNSGLVPTVWD